MKEVYEKLEEITERLPSFCKRYLKDGTPSDLTALNYARDLLYFFNLSVEIYPKFPNEVSKITIEDLASLTAADINLYLSVMEHKYKLKEKTRARRKTALSGLFLYLTNSERVLEYNPVSGAKKVKIPSKEVVIYLTRKEQDKLLQTIEYGTGLDKKTLDRHEYNKKRDMAIVVLFLDTGLRISELCGINIKDIDFDGHYIMVMRKGHKEQKVYFSDESEYYIKEYLRERLGRFGYVGDNPLFISNRDQRISVRTVQYMVEKYVKAALPGRAEQISPHKLRSSFAMEFYKQSKDILMLQHRMGHKSIIATNIYAKAADDEKAEKTRNWRKT